MDNVMEQIQEAQNNIAYLYARIMEVSDMRLGYSDLSNLGRVHMEIISLQLQIRTEYSKIEQLRQNIYGQSR